MTALAPRELDVLRLVATGAKQEAVAHELGITVQTVKNHLTSAYRRLGVTSAIEAFGTLGWLRVPVVDEIAVDDLQEHVSSLAAEAQRIADGLRELVAARAAA